MAAWTAAWTAAYLADYSVASMVAYWAEYSAVCLAASMADLMDVPLVVQKVEQRAVSTAELMVASKAEQWGAMDAGTNCEVIISRINYLT